MAQPPDIICDAIRILTNADIMDYNGHVSCRAADGGFFINTGSSNRAAMTSDQVCRVDAQGQPTGERPPNEASLHHSIYKIRPDVQAIVHGHPKWTTLFTLTRTLVPVVMPQGCLVADLPVYPHAHSISTDERGDHVATAMEERCGVLLAGHGSVTVGSSLHEAVALAIYAEQNAERAYMAKALGEATQIEPGDWPSHQTNLNKPFLFRKCWDFYLKLRS